MAHNKQRHLFPEYKPSWCRMGFGSTLLVVNLGTPILFYSTNTFANGSMSLSACEAGLQGRTTSELKSKGLSLESLPSQRSFDSFYSYPGYHGPENQILRTFYADVSQQRNPKLLEILKNGEVFSFEEVVSQLGLAIEGLSEDNSLQMKIDRSDPMSRYTPRARFYKKGGSGVNTLVSHWIYKQYPELKPLFEKWREQSIQGGYLEPIERSKIEDWMNKHPEYKNGLLIFARPSLWNKVALKMENQYDDAFTASRELKIESIVALFNPHLSENRFDDLTQLLRTLAGPYQGRIGQAGVVKKIAAWVLTQYPELMGAIELRPEKLSADSLSSLFGRTLGMFPIEWAIGNYKDILKNQEGLSPLPRQWEEQVLPQIMAFLNGTKQPNIETKQFLLKDPTAKVRRPIRTGDTVELRLRAYLELNGEAPSSVDDVLLARVDAVIKRNGQVVGFDAQLAIREKPTNIKSTIIGFEETNNRFWLSDFEVEDSRILSSTESPAQELVFENLEFPEDSGEVTFQFGREQQAPVSVGDLIQLQMLQPLERHSSAWTDLVITGFERDQQDRVVALFGYKVGASQIGSLIRGENGKPLGFFKDGEPQYFDSAKTPIIKIPLSNIKRLDEGTRFEVAGSTKKASRLPQSPKRSPFSRSRSWYPSNSQGLTADRDTQSFKLQIGSPTHTEGESIAYKAPVAVGDEVYLRFRKPESTLGWNAVRGVVESVIFEDGRPVGLTGIELNSSNDEKQWFFKDLIVEESFIETSPWSGDGANRIPGSFHKREAFKRDSQSSGFAGFRDAFESFFNSEGARSASGAENFEDMFGYRYTSDADISHLTKWTDVPLTYQHWLEEFKIVDRAQSKMQWAYWVLQVSPQASKEEITMAKRKLSRQFHPDRHNNSAESNLAATAINVAYQILEKNHL